MEQRRCNQYGCKGLMRPTRKLEETPYSDEAYRLRYYRCTGCGHENLWLNDPAMDGSFGQVHSLKVKGGGHSGASMMSDPRFHPPKRPTRKS